MAEPTSDSISVLQQVLAAAAAAGVFVGGVVATFFSARKKNEPTADETAELRARVAKDELRRELEHVIEGILSAARIANETRFSQFEVGFYKKIDDLTKERRESFQGLDDRVRDLEMGRWRER